MVNELELIGCRIATALVNLDVLDQVRRTRTNKAERIKVSAVRTIRLTGTTADASLLIAVIRYYVMLEGN
jgi:hypothetical protein